MQSASSLYLKSHQLPIETKRVKTANQPTLRPQTSNESKGCDPVFPAQRSYSPEEARRISSRYKLNLKAMDELLIQDYL